MPLSMVLHLRVEARALDHLPEGAELITEFISPEREFELLGRIDEAAWMLDLKRRVQHYGWRYDYRARRVGPQAKLGPLPDWLTLEGGTLCDRGFFDQEPDQIIINEYMPGQGISPHIDCIPCFGPVAASLTLGGGTQMQFDHPASAEQTHAFLEPRSLLVLTGPARFEWRHGIPARKTDWVEGRRLPRNRRVSLTYRNVTAVLEG